MSLNDEIGNFSKRREVEEKPKKQYDDAYDEDEYDDWEDDEDSDYDDFSFKMYKLDQLGKFNTEVKEMEELISPWWKNLKTIFSKSILGKIGILEYKKKSLLRDDSFHGVKIFKKNNSLNALEVFSENLKKSHWRRFKFNVYGIIFYVLLAYWSGWNMIWYFLIGWSLFDMGLGYFKYAKQKEWLLKAETFIQAQDANEESLEIEETNESRLAEIMEFNEAISKQENEHWSIKLYDAIANSFTRKK